MLQENSINQKNRDPARTYAFYSFNMIMYGAILSFGSAAIVYGVIAKLEKPIR